MRPDERAEARIINKNKILVVLSKIEDEHLIKHFCGTTIEIDKLASLELPDFSNKTVYLCDAPLIYQAPRIIFVPTTGILWDALNQEVTSIFEEQAPLNHVLAQIYRNTSATENQKQTKAKISAHADKTKDMPSNGVMAFCTFYDGLEKLQPLSADSFDYGYKNTSGLTRLQFRLKNKTGQGTECTLLDEFTVTLYPGSVFFMPLSTNRLYTHAIKPSMLDADRLPTRLGYVVRCSSTQAVHVDGKTFLKQQEKLINLEPPIAEGMSELRKLYSDENKQDGFIDYGEKFLFSMNKGDKTQH